MGNKLWHEPACAVSQALVTEFEGWASVDKDSSMQFDWDDLAGEDQCPTVSHDCCVSFLMAVIMVHSYHHLTENGHYGR